MMRRLYRQLDHALEQWKETREEVERVGGAFWEVREFQRLPGVGPIAAHVFSAIIEEPSRFGSKFKLWKYSQLGITDRTSDHKPLGYQRLDRRGNAELKTSPTTSGEQPANRPPVPIRSKRFTSKAAYAPGAYATPG